MKKICFNCGRQLKKGNVCTFCGYKNTVFTPEKNNELLDYVVFWAVLSVVGIIFSLCIASLFREALPVITPLAFVIPAYTIPKLICAIFKGWAPYISQLIVIVAEIALYCLIVWWQHKYYPYNLGFFAIYLLLYIFYGVILVHSIIVLVKFINFVKDKNN